ncbi:DUF2958 domain-containing protein [Maliponia aquimaris]|nr:DUF2958 domain-containing protein [Maliponia aquimaris]
MKCIPFPNSARDQLVRNCRESKSAGKRLDHHPVVMLFTPDADAAWLLSESDPDKQQFYGLCDLGFGAPEVGIVSLSELLEIEGPSGLPIEHDPAFTAIAPLSVYAAEARKAKRIVV